MAKKSTEDLRAYWQEIATKAGVDAGVIEAIGDSLGNEAVAKAFRQGFVPVSDHHSTLDSMKAEYEAQQAKVNDWYNNQALPAYQSNLAGIEQLRQYEALYGPIESGSATRAEARELGFNSKAELDKYLDDRFRAERAGYVSLSKTLPKMSVDYYNRFHKVLDPDEVEKISVAKGLPPDLAYQAYIAPEVEAARQAEFEAKIKEAEERGARSVASRHNLPIDSTPKESSPFFDREATPAKPMSELEEDRASRSAFLEGWNSYAADVASKFKP